MIKNMLMRLSEIKNLKVKVLFEGNLEDSKRISYEDARLLCDLQDNFGIMIRADTPHQKEKYESLEKLGLLNQLKTGEYGLSGIAQRARYLI